ncbi:16S rRNA (guanine(527)-N(7))-methyltransferase RsmG [Microaerobacter geothermalis]|uniref:16S rRNA (guanine(527)-N(7))-methyltransferase RsmG n=1 Tax=Microaerobacter geothermalis TaxID=674972 RepID=UPI001F3C02AC|nr:16S rRNA (guanine(527)-N(7))-methyltransferase RsmG [Microaerobacter geothermalis]MCF6095102.1 16S rRNA (guanine(527)-N(7))-methyltransferase RsmG [Microaerobacter geothermalis]
MVDNQFIQSHLADYGIQLTAKQWQQLSLYYQLLIEWNKRMNLTGITDFKEVYVKHFYDSMTPSFFYPFESISKLADVGAGAGFPSLPLKILFPHLKVTIIDSLNKRIQFLHYLSRELKLDHIELIHGRAEELGQNKKYREKFDAVMARAVAKMQVLSELCLPLTSVDGQFIAMKGNDIKSEMMEALHAIRILGGTVTREEIFELPYDMGKRSIIYIRKIKKTPDKYPRKPGIPSKQPIVK